MRQSAADIDHGILDVAAGLFATHGFDHTSVQQIADAVGYSKPGLLHRFGSKEALHRAVLAEVAETVQELAGHAVAAGGRPAELRQVLDTVTRKALARPGMVQLMLAVFDPSGREPGTAAIREAGSRLVSALDQPVGGPAERLRVVLALKLIATGAMTEASSAEPVPRIDHDDLVVLLASLAHQVMTSRGETTEQMPPDQRTGRQERNSSSST